MAHSDPRTHRTESDPFGSFDVPPGAPRELHTAGGRGALPPAGPHDADRDGDGGYGDDGYGGDGGGGPR